MIISQIKRKENIAEYLLYMWQIEDLIRACGLNMDVLNENVVSKFPVQSETERKEIYNWYESLIEMMRMENVQEKGHLQLNKNIIIELDDFHSQLMSSGQVPAYNAKFFHVLPFVNQLRMKAEPGIGDIELCFNFMYGMMMLRMKKQSISPETAQTQTEVSKFLVLLAKNFKAFRNGELDLE